MTAQHEGQSMDGGRSVDEAQSVREADGVSRRDAIKRGLVVGGAVAWTVPTIQALGMSAAHADEPSTTTVKPPREAPRGHVPPAAVTPGQSAGPATEPDTLAKTGSDIPVAGIAATAAGAIGAGAVILKATRRREDEAEA